MGGALACCTKLRTLVLDYMGADDAAMAAFGGALGSGAAPALATLNLLYNKIGDEGARHLGDALARGAAPALEQGVPMAATRAPPPSKRCGTPGPGFESSANLHIARHIATRDRQPHIMCAHLMHVSLPSRLHRSLGWGGGWGRG